MATNQERFFGSAYAISRVTVIDTSVFGLVYKKIIVDGNVVASFPEDRYTEWLKEESTWKYGDNSTITEWIA